MIIKVLVFGVAKDLVGDNNISLQIEHDSTSSAELRQTLINKFPKLSVVSNFMIAVNRQYASGETKITNHDEVAIIPPTNGG